MFKIAILLCVGFVFSTGHGSPVTKQPSLYTLFTQGIARSSELISAYEKEHSEPVSLVTVKANIVQAVQRRYAGASMLLNSYEKTRDLRKSAECVNLRNETLEAFNTYKDLLNACAEEVYKLNYMTLTISENGKKSLESLLTPLKQCDNWTNSNYIDAENECYTNVAHYAIVTINKTRHEIMSNYEKVKAQKQCVGTLTINVDGKVFQLVAKARRCSGEQ